MKCPRCQIGLVNKSYEGVAVDCCTSCSGTWLDEGELNPIIDSREKFFKAENIQKTISARSFVVPEAQNESRIPCPNCSKMMKTFIYGGDSGIVIDRCSDNHGLWFDQGELEKIQMFREFWQNEAQKRGKDWENMANSVTIDQQPFSLSPFKILVNFFFD